MRGKFIVVEGIDGAGKSTHLEFIAQTIAAIKGVQVVQTREPGGTPLAEGLREILLHQEMDGETQTLLAFAARRDHLGQKIRPALTQGHWVLSDRFTDSTRAYQGGGAGISMDWIDGLAQTVHQGLQPDRVYLFDVPSALAAERRGLRGNGADQFEVQNVAFFDRVRAVYLQQAKVFSEVYRLIDGTEPIEKIQKLLHEDITSL